MTLKTEFESQLAAHANDPQATIMASSGPRKLTCRLANADALAVSFHELSVATSELADADMQQLRSVSESLSKRLTYLMEPISPIEFDGDACVVQLRSNPPQREDNGRSYYELLVRRGGEILLCRFHKESSGPRQRVPATVTREVLRRLVDDFSAVLD